MLILAKYRSGELRGKECDLLFLSLTALSDRCASSLQKLKGAAGAGRGQLRSREACGAPTYGFRLGPQDHAQAADCGV
jgi:hypothetical protein